MTRLDTWTERPRWACKRSAWRARGTTTRPWEAKRIRSSRTSASSPGPPSRYSPRPMDPSSYPLAQLADQVGTPFYLYDAGILRTSLRALADLVGFAPASGGAPVQVRYAMKANS